MPKSAVDGEDGSVYKGKFLIENLKNVSSKQIKKDLKGMKKGNRNIVL